MQVGVGEAAEVFKVCSQDSSAASVGEQIADIPVPRGRGRLGGGSLQGFSPGQNSTALVSMLTFQFRTVVSHNFTQDRVQELLPQVLALWKGLLMVFFALFPE